MISPRLESNRLAKALTAIHRSTSVASVHDARVSCRRLDVFLRLGGREALRSDLRWLRRGLGPLRDLDVLRSLGLPLSRAMERQLERERAVLARSARALVARPRTRALLRALATEPPTGRRQATTRCRVLRGLAREATGASTFDGLHGERRAVRRLRFALEWLGDDATMQKERQAVLGIVCDVDAVRRIALRRQDREAALVLTRAVHRLVALIVEAS